LIALAVGHDVLTQGNWTGGELRQIVVGSLRAFDANGGRLRVDGPSLRVAPEATLPLTMVLHELATNAIKYGALSNDTGRLEIAWTVDDAAGRLRLRWVESGGPLVSTPSRKGFGSRLIERTLTFDLDAEVRVDFASSGLVCTIDAPLQRVQAH
jgi:two-component sensor histidine kinase